MIDDQTAAAPGAELVESKTAFAARCNVDKSAVSHWIDSGRIDSAALVGEGRGAQVRVAVALEQLRRRLDISQRLGNGLSTRLDNDAPAPNGNGRKISPLAPSPADEGGEGAALAADAPIAAAQPAAPRVDTIEDQIKRERLEGIQRQNRKLAEDEAARAGRLTDAGQAAVQMARIARDILSTFEAALPEFATAIATQYKLPQRDVLHALRAKFRDVRASAAAAFKRRSDDLPALVEIEIGEAGALAAPETKAAA